ncbi:VOC family protein [Streptomyces sp. NPDC089919]|uniref:VOC family protein n=1 Tax=Streptomyces sp. NPDC089919 TaxID=3155188 RepID=UPI00341A8BEB
MTATPVHWKLVIDAHDPHAQADFWSAALHYQVEDHSTLIDKLLGLGVIHPDVLVEHRDRYAWRDAAAVRHPDDPYDPESGTGLGRRVLFNRVPRSDRKAAKNRLHIDLHGPAGQRDQEVARLTGLGGQVLTEVQEAGGQWTVMTDPEGNEFCVH